MDDDDYDDDHHDDDCCYDYDNVCNDDCGFDNDQDDDDDDEYDGDSRHLGRKTVSSYCHGCHGHKCRSTDQLDRRDSDQKALACT